MRLRFRDDYGGWTSTGKRVGGFTGALMVLTLGLALGRSTSRPIVHSPDPTPAASAPATLTHPADPANPAPHTSDGAVSAAARADCVLGGPLVTSPTDYPLAIAAIVVPEKRGDAAELAKQEAAQVDQQTGAVTAARQGVHVFITCVPLGYRVESYSDTAASISVWTEQIVGVDQSYAPAAAYVTDTLAMRWTTQGWRLDTSSALDSAWAPAVRQPELPSNSTLPAQMLNFTRFGTH